MSTEIDYEKYMRQGTTILLPVKSVFVPFAFCDEQHEKVVLAERVNIASKYFSYIEQIAESQRWKYYAIKVLNGAIVLLGAKFGTIEE